MLKTVIDRLKDRLKEHGQTYKIDELCLDQIPFQKLSPQYCKAIEKCVNIEYITFQGCELSDLSILPRLPKLKYLELDDNKLQDSGISQLGMYTSLRQLTLKNNKISKLDTFSCLMNCKALTQLSIQGNPVAENGLYRAILFTKLPQLEIIDQVNRQGSQVIYKEEQEEDSQMSGSESGEEQSEEGERDSPTKLKKPN